MESAEGGLFVASVDVKQTGERAIVVRKNVISRFTFYP